MKTRTISFIHWCAWPTANDETCGLPFDSTSYLSHLLNACLTLTFRHVLVPGTAQKSNSVNTTVAVTRLQTWLPKITYKKMHTFRSHDVTAASQRSQADCTGTCEPFQCVRCPSTPRSFGMCAPIVFLSNWTHPFVTNIFLFTGHYVADPCHICHTKRERHSAEMQKKKNENTTVLIEPKTHNLRIQMLAELSIGILWSSAVTWKNHRRSDVIVKRGPFFASCRTKNDIRQIWVISYVLSYHIGQTCPVKECSWSRTGAIFGTEKKVATHVPPRSSLTELVWQSRTPSARCPVIVPWEAFP